MPSGWLIKEAVHYTTSHTAIKSRSCHMCIIEAYCESLQHCNHEEQTYSSKYSNCNNQPRASSFPGVSGVFILHPKLIFLKFLELTDYNNVTDTPPPHPALFAQRCRSFRIPLTTQLPYCNFHVVINMKFVGQLLAHDPERGEIISSPEGSDWFWSPSRLLPSGCWSFFYLE